jgi:hypothetical protein
MHGKTLIIISVCICIYICIHIFIYICYIYVCVIHTHTHTHTHTNTSIYICIYIHTHTYRLYKCIYLVGWQSGQAHLLYIYLQYLPILSKETLYSVKRDLVTIHIFAISTYLSIYLFIYTGYTYMYIYLSIYLYWIYIYVYIPGRRRVRPSTFCTHIHIDYIMYNTI